MKRCLLLSVIMMLSVTAFSACSAKTEPVPESIAETTQLTAPATQTIPIPTETTSTAAEETSETTAASGDDSVKLVGSWTFAVDAESGYYYTFNDDGSMQISSELTELLSVQDGLVKVTEGTFMGEYPYTVEGSRLVANDADKCILDLTALETEDASALQGLYRVNICSLYPDAETRGLQIRFEPEKRWIVSNGTYSTEEGTLHLECGDMTFSQEYAFEGEKLILKEEDGAETVLVRFGEE